MSRILLVVHKIHPVQAQVVVVRRLTGMVIMKLVAGPVIENQTPRIIVGYFCVIITCAALAGGV
jgi:hypothetical protein